MQEPFHIDFDQPIEKLESHYARESQRLGEIEERLGTRKEQEHDIERARRIAHIIRNLQLIINLSDTPETRSKGENEKR